MADPRARVARDVRGAHTWHVFPDLLGQRLSSPTTTTTKLFIYIYIQGITGWYKRWPNGGPRVYHHLDRPNRINNLGGTHQLNYYRISHLQTTWNSGKSRSQTYDLKKCTTRGPPIMLIPQPVEGAFPNSPKTGQRKTWLPRLLPEKLDAAKPGAKKVESASPKKWNPHCGFQKNSLRRPGKRVRLGSKTWMPQ